MSKKISRRDFLKFGGAGLATLWFTGSLAQAFKQKKGIITGGEPAGKGEVAKAAASGAKYGYKKPKAVARSVINIYLDGGPSHIDMFDPKPDAGRDYYGNYRNVSKTNVDGIVIGEKLPLLAKMADKYALIRSMTHTSNAHETGHYYMTTGDMSKGTLVYPSYEAALACLTDKDYKGTLPIFITLTEASTRFSESGFLGPRYKSFETGGNPSDSFFNVEGIVNKGSSDAQLQRKKELLAKVENLSTGVDATSGLVSELHDYQDRTWSLILGDDRQAFDLSKEPAKVREKYGLRSKFGQSCLVARRLVERGVPLINIRFPGWDTHKQHFARMDERLMETDMGIASLIEELDNTGLLDTTIIVVGGEFGRTPKISWEPPWNGGRGHYGKAFSYLVAGGGFKGGEVVGRTDSKAESVVERPVYPADLIASIYYLMGIDPMAGTLPYLNGTVPLLPSYGREATSNGMLSEIIRV